MSYEPTPKQALFLWRLISAETEDERQPLKSKTRPRLIAKELRPLVDNGLIELVKRDGRQGEFIALADKAWAWAATAVDVELMKSRSSVGAEALQGLLRRLLPFLERRDVPLAALFSTPNTAEPPQPTDRANGRGEPALTTTNRETASAAEHNGSSRPLPQRIEAACLSLAGGAKQKRVRLSALRKQLSSVQRTELDQALLRMQDEGRLVLYRDDNTAALTADDQDAALLVGNAPRHLVYLEE